MRRLLVVSCLLVVSACGGAAVNVPTESPAPALEHTERSPTSNHQFPAPDPTPRPAAVEVWEGFAATGTAGHALAGMTHGPLDVFEGPGGTWPTRTLPATTILGTATVVTAVGEPTEDGWLEVLVPGRPNSGTGWIDTEDVDLFVVADRIVIDLSDRELVYYIDGVEKMRSAITVGTDHNPTPTGRFFVTDRVLIDGGGPWGPAAIGLSARSETITEFNGGDGIIGIHGTNKPGSIGQAASLGCVRLPNELITDLRDMVSLGTPVEIRA